jgi:hypothetical protein
MRSPYAHANPITPQDHERLLHRLLSKPVTVLIRFRQAQIGSLSELEIWQAIKETQPEAAERIRAVAALLGIPETAPKASWRPGGPGKRY